MNDLSCKAEGLRPIAMQTCARKSNGHVQVWSEGLPWRDLNKRVCIHFYKYLCSDIYRNGIFTFSLKVQKILYLQY